MADCSRTEIILAVFQPVRDGFMNVSLEVKRRTQSTVYLDTSRYSGNIQKLLRRKSRNIGLLGRFVSIAKENRKLLSRSKII